MTSNTITGATNLGDLTEHRHLTPETKASLKTTEFFAYLGAVLAVAVTAFVVNGDAGTNSADPFGALDALRFITYLTIGYMVARGLAKSGSRERYDA